MERLNKYIYFKYASIKVTQNHKEISATMFSYQILQLNEDDLSVGAQDFFIVTSTFTKTAGQQENHQDTTE